MIEKVTGIAKVLFREISKNSTVILTGMAVTGVVSTGVLAIKATPKALALLDAEIYKLYKTETNGAISFSEWLGLDHDSSSWSDRSKMLSAKEKFKLAWKCFIPTTAVGLVTIGCILGAHGVHSRRNAALASLYSLSEAAFKEYQAKVVETIGKNKELKVRDDICEDTLKKHPVGNTEIIITGKGDTIFFDEMSGRYFKSSMDKIRRTEAKLNRELRSEMFITLNEFYNELGLSSIKLGESVGWDIDKDYITITPSAHLTEDEDPCLMLNYDVVPRYK